MKKWILILPILVLFSTSQNALGVTPEFHGFVQLTAESGEGTNSNSQGRNLKFGSDRARFITKLKGDKALAVLQVDFLKSSDPEDNKHSGFTEIIKDAFVDYDWAERFKTRIGVFKAPVGMDFNVSGKKLDITKRSGLTKSLVLERVAGVMGTVRPLDYFTIDLGVFGPAKRSASVGTGGEHGSANSYAARVSFDHEGFHAETSLGISEDVEFDTRGQDYKVFDLGISQEFGNTTLKAEYIKGENINGNAGKDQSSWFLHAGYKVMQNLEGIVRFYSSKAEDVSTGTTREADLTNTFFGINFWPEESHRLQLNYVLVGGDDRDTSEAGSTYKWTTVASGGYTANAILGQWQFSF